MERECPAARLVGVKLESGWVISERLPKSEADSGGAFSIGYKAINADGEFGFLKAFDYTSAFETEDPPEELRRLTDTFLAERTVLEHCEGKHFSHVVKVLESGTLRLDGIPMNAVSYLLFEWAPQDGRAVVTNADPSDHLPMIALSHHAAVGVRQLHNAGIIHQDIRPSNFLVLQDRAETIGKLSDLGRAFMRNRPAPHDDETIAGAPTYASPEQLYNCERRLKGDDWRLAADMYMFGNLVAFLLLGVPYSGLLQMNLDPSQHWKNWGGTFDDVLPSLLDAHGRAVSKVRESLRTEIAESIATIINELCQPDPNQRGDRVARRQGNNPFELMRYITRLDLIHRRAAIRRKEIA